MIRQPGDYNSSAKRFRMLIAGHPGIGKSTLALSSPKPLWIDVDRGFDRVEAKFRKPYIQPENYQELLDDLIPQNTDGFETLVFDTGGQMIELMKPYVIRQNAQNGQRDGSLSIKGYGAVAREFKRLMDYCFYTLNKNIIVLFHAKEEKDGDSTRLRLLVEGSTKDNVWQPMDIGGFMEMIGDERTIGFSNCERYYAKGVHGINGVWKIPNTKNAPNDFVTRLFEKMSENIREETEYVEEQKKLYETIMMDMGESIKQMHPEDIESVQNDIKEIKHVLTSEQELKAMFKARLKEIGYHYDREAKAYVADDRKSA